MVEHLSYSQLNTATTCGEQYRLQRIIRVPQTPAWALIGGSSVHTATEQRDLSAHGVDVSVESFEDIFERLTLEAEEESGLDRSAFRASGRASNQWPDKENAAWWLANGPAMVNRWTNWVRNVPWNLWVTPHGLPAAELEFNLWLERAQVIIKGFIDRVFVDGDGNLIVVDLKTGASKQSSYRQLGTYKVALKDKWPDQPIKFGAFWDARSGATGAVMPLNEYDIDRVEWQYNALKTMRAEGLFLPAPSNMCGSCSVASWCYEVNGENAGQVRPPWVDIEEWEGGEVA